VVSEYVKHTIKHLIGGDKIFVIHNGVDTGFFNPSKRNLEYLEKKYKIDLSKPLITFIGELIRRKRPEIIVELARRNKDKTFIIIGRLNRQLNFKRLIKDTNNIIWISIMKRKDVACLLASSDIFVLPSLYEGFGMVVVEAMASGCPVIVTDHGAMSELVIDGVDGFKIKRVPNEIEAFSELINDLLKNEELKKKIITNALKKAQENFNWERLTLQWKKVLNTINSTK